MSKELIVKQFPTPDVKKWQENWLALYESINGHCEINHILNIGVGEGHAALAWNNFISDLWSIQYLENLEIEESICKSARETQNPLITNVQLGDVRNIDEIYSDDSFDLIFWSHGPERILRDEWEETFKKLESIALHAVILQMPWGSGYDYDDGHISESIKQGEIEKFGYTVMYDGIENTKNAGILGYKLL